MEKNKVLINLITQVNLNTLVNSRPDEQKLGEALTLLEDWETLKTHPARICILGIPEDIGVRANLGKAGTALAWETFLKTFCNLPVTPFFNPKDILLLGNVVCDPEMEKSKTSKSVEELGSLVSEIDEKVAAIASKVAQSGKKLVVIGGGHNNAYGLLKGFSVTKNKPVHCINIDAHADFRPVYQRHSGNGFTHAFNQNYLGNYYIIGLQTQANSKTIWDALHKQQNRIKYDRLDEINTIHKSIQASITFMDNTSFGLEVDLDSIAGMGSSAVSPFGFSFHTVQRIVSEIAQNTHCNYLHLCEGNPLYNTYPNQVGKALAILTHTYLENVNFHNTL